MIKAHIVQSIRCSVSAFGVGILDFVYPPFCSVCESRLQMSEKLVCESCWTALPRLSDSSDEHGFPGIERLISVWEYSDAFQSIVHEMKFFRKKSLANRMAEEMSQLLASDPDMSHADYLIPVPLHRLRFRERGFNQSSLLTRYISEKIGIPVNESLRRIRMTRSQSTLDSEARRHNVDGAFAVQGPEQISRKNVILVDDVTTTGSTLCACAAALRNSGAASKVFAVTAGRTL